MKSMVDRTAAENSKPRVDPLVRFRRESVVPSRAESRQSTRASFHIRSQGKCSDARNSSPKWPRGRAPK